MTNFENVSTFEIPDQCIACPVQCATAYDLEPLIKSKEMTTVLAESMVGPGGQILDEAIEMQVPSDDAETIKSHIRQVVGQNMESIDDEIANVYRLASAYAISCSGVLKMRANKDGVTYTVAICTSPLLYADAAKTGYPLPAHIEAT